ncbi:MAG TPA: hypothetical protein DCR32_00080 [Opitutae bacterium]|nr:hypothetical protein [Opitutae bacterium]
MHRILPIVHCPKSTMKNIIISIFISITVISAHAYESSRDAFPFPITGNSDRDRAITYGGVGAAAGAIIGNQMSGDRSEKRAIGAGVGAVTGAILANRENNRQRDIQQRKAQREYELEVRRAAEERRRDILVGRTVSDAEILREKHEVEELENEIARIEQERAAAEARARRIRELQVQKAELERELGNLRSIR